MQKNKTVIEVVSPLRFGNNKKEYEIHNFYKTISILKNHTIISVSNISRNANDLIEDLTKISKML